MPRVPQLAPSVAPSALPNAPNARIRVRTTPADMGGEVAETAGRVFKDVWEQERQKADEIAVMSARRQLQQYQNQLLYDPQNGALTKKGKDSFSTPETVMPELDKHIDSIATGLNDRQRTAFMRSATETRMHTDVTLQRHVHAERQRYDDEETQAFIATERDSATQNYNDPIRVQMAIENQVDAAAAYGRRNGKGADWLKKQTQEIQSQTHLMVIQKAVAAGDDSYAAAYHAEVKDLLTGRESTEAVKLVEDATYRGRSQKEADRIVGVGQDYPTPRSDAQKMVNEIEDPKLRDLVQSRVDQFYARQDAFTRKKEEESFDTLMAMIDNNVPYARLPIQYLNQLSGEQRRAVRIYSKAREKGDDIVTDDATYYSLMRLASSDPATFADPRKTDLMIYRHKLDEQDWKRLVELQRAAGARDDKYENKISGYRTTQQVVDGALRSAGIDPTPKDTDQKSGARVERFRRAVDQKVMEFKMINKRDPSTDDTRKIVDDLLLEGPVPGTGMWGWFQTKKRVFELEPGESIAVTIKQVPEEHKAAITRAFQRVNGRAPSDEEIVQQFQSNIKLRAESNR